MFETQNLRRLDYRVIPIILCLMVISLLIISSVTGGGFSPLVKNQMRAFAVGIFAYVFVACLDYQKFREWTWILYILMIVLLVGLYFTPSIQNVRRWYKIPGIPIALQPSEFSKVIVVVALSWFLEKQSQVAKNWQTAFLGSLIVLIPFALILKQPDLGTALVLFPITLGMFYFGGINKLVVRGMILAGIGGIAMVFLLFSGMIAHEDFRPVATKFVKDYQYERLNPNTYHQRAGQTAIALGGITGSGWQKSQFTGRKWLPFAQTDSVFCVFAEEFGLVGSIFVLGLYFGLIYFSFQVTAVAKDVFGRLLSAGISVYLAMHVVVNIGMMCGFLPITGVPLILVTYGGSSVVATLTALGILQSIYCKRFMF